MKFYDPRFLLTLIAVAAASYFLGGYKADVICAANEQTASDQAQIKLDAANARVKSAQDSAAADINNLNNQFKTDLQNETDKRTRFTADVLSGAIRLSIPVARRGSASSADTGTTDGNRNETRAELTPEAGNTLAAIADDGDDAIRQLNTCIDAYNVARGSLVQAP